MPSYRICFINEIPRGNHLFRCCQRSIVIRSARSPERAIEAAKKRFARIEGIPDWQIHAGMIEIREIDLSEPGTRSATPHPQVHGQRHPFRPAAARHKRRTS
jgi:hypothetical protein